MLTTRCLYVKGNDGIPTTVYIFKAYYSIGAANTQDCCCHLVPDGLLEIFLKNKKTKKQHLVKTLISKANKTR
jgi:hypothetical protein